MKMNLLVEYRLDFELVLEFWKVCQEPEGIKKSRKYIPHPVLKPPNTLDIKISVISFKGEPQ